VTEEEIKAALGSENEEYKQLLTEHKSLDVQLAEFDSHAYLSPEEELERKKIQKQKLAKKDRMAEMVRTFQSGAAAG
jgi:uncharacterized protein YdcH (DUF465 family)